MPLIKKTLDQLENWDTLELWFKEVEELTENIKKTIDAKSGVVKESELEEQDLESSTSSEQKSAAPQIDRHSPPGQK